MDRFYLSGGRSIAAVLATALLLSVTSCASKHEGREIVLSGAWAVYPTAVAWAEAYRKAHPGVRIEVTAGGAGKGAADVIAGLVDIGMVSREPDESEISRGIIPVYVLHDAVFPVVSQKNPSLKAIIRKGISRKSFGEIYLAESSKKWGDIVPGAATDPVHVYTRSDSCGAAASFAKFLGNRKQENLKGIGIYGDPGILEAVLKDPLGIGYSNFSYVFGRDGKHMPGIVPVPIDADGNGLAEGIEVITTREDAIRAIDSKKYPASRKNYFYVKGEIGGLKKDFLRFVLSDEGERIVRAVGTSLPVPRKEREEIVRKLKLD